MRKSQGILELEIWFYFRGKITLFPKNLLGTVGNEAGQVGGGAVPQAVPTLYHLGISAAHRWVKTLYVIFAVKSLPRS